MKTFSSIILILFFTTSGIQEDIYGKYKNGLGETLILNSDKTFEYRWKFDLASSWNIGTWKIEGEKYIYLTLNEVKDTLKTENGIELVLSNDKTSNEITNQEHIINLISGGGQSRHLPPKKLRIRKGKLYTYSKEGKIQNKKIKSVMNTNILLKPWFAKTSE